MSEMNEAPIGEMANHEILMANGTRFVLPKADADDLYQWMRVAKVDHSDSSDTESEGN